MANKATARARVRYRQVTGEDCELTCLDGCDVSDDDDDDDDDVSE